MLDDTEKKKILNPILINDTFIKAAKLIVSEKNTSRSLFSQQLGFGSSYTGTLMFLLEELQIISTDDSDNDFFDRKILVSNEGDLMNILHEIKDDLFDKAARLLVNEVKKYPVNPVSTFLKENLSLGSNRASRIIKQLERAEIISYEDENNRHNVLFDGIFDLEMHLQNLQIKYNSFSDFSENILEEKTENLDRETLDRYYSLYEQKKYSDVIDYFEEKLIDSDSSEYLKIVDKYLWALFHNEGTEEKAFKKVKKYLEDYPENTDWNNLAGHIAKWFGGKEKEIDLLNEAILFYEKCNNTECISEVNAKIKEIFELEKERIAKEKLRIATEMDREQERRKEQEEQEEQEKQKELEQKNREEEEERERQQREEEENAKIGTRSFKSSVTRGGDAIFPEHIYVDDHEVTWEKKTGVFSKDSKTIPMNNITQIDIETSLIGAKIKIRSKGFGFIQGENFTKSDVKEIKSLIEKAQGNL